jgi:predicted ATP-dependent serine protease
MSETGLKQVENPSAIFLSNQATPLPGSINFNTTHNIHKHILVKSCNTAMFVQYSQLQGKAILI